MLVMELLTLLPFTTIHVIGESDATLGCGSETG